MKQIFAIWLLFAFSFTLTESLFAGFFPDSSRGSKLPACCRRDGKHRCQKSNNSSKTGHSAPAVKVETAKCSQYPPALSSAASILIVGEPAFRVEATPLSVFSSTLREYYTQYRASHSRTRQKRGPPSQV